MTVTIRPYRPADLGAIYEICLLIGDNGRDASPLYRERRILGDLYAGQYGRFAPEFAFTAEDTQGVCGFTLGVLDTVVTGRAVVGDRRVEVLVAVAIDVHERRKDLGDVFTLPSQRDLLALRVGVDLFESFAPVRHVMPRFLNARSTSFDASMSSSGRMFGMTSMSVTCEPNALNTSANSHPTAPAPTMMID